MRLSVWRWLVPIPAAFVLQAVYGLLFANGVFVSVLHDPALTQAVGLTALFTSLGVTAFGVLLHNASDPVVYRSAPRLISLFGSVGIGAQIIMAYALHHNIHLLLYFAAALVGAGSGSVYVVSIILLQEWVPESAGLVTGTGLLIGGGGSLFGISSFKHLTAAIGVIPAMAVAGCVSGTVSAAASLLIQRPPTGWSPQAEVPCDSPPAFDEDRTVDKEGELRNDPVVAGDNPDSFTAISIQPDETTSLLSHKENNITPGTRLSIYDILVDPAFPFVFTAVLAMVGPGFGFVLAFPRMMHTLFDLDLAVANDTLFWVTLVGVVGRILIGTAIDLLQSPSDAFGNGFFGAKRMTTALLALQCTAMAVMPICIRHGWTNTFAIATALVYITFSGGAVVTACLARTVFTPENATLVFALLGLAMGVGRALFSVLVASGGGSDGDILSPFETLYEYDAFVQSAFVVSAIGLVCSYYVSPSKFAYQNSVNRPVFVDVRV